MPSQSRSFQKRILAEARAANPDLELIGAPVETTAKAAQSEHDFQAAVIAACDRRALTDPRYSLILAIPNGGARHPAVAAKLKAKRDGKAEIGLLVYRIREGVGVPDPDPDIDRDLWDRYRTPDEKDAERQIQQELEEMQKFHAEHRRATSKPAQTVPGYDDPWQTALFDFAQGRQLPDGVLERARAEVVGEQGEAQVWRITLDPADGAHLDWMQVRGLTLIRSTLASILRRAVLVDVVLPEAEAA